MLARLFEIGRYGDGDGKVAVEGLSATAVSAKGTAQACLTEHLVIEHALTYHFQSYSGNESISTLLHNM
jgi:hypothetical protein